MVLALGSIFNKKQLLDWFSLENAAWLQHKFGWFDGVAANSREEAYRIAPPAPARATVGV
jgi:hypothetical protein